MEIKTIEQIMHEVANELKYKDWNVLRQCHAYKLSSYDAIWKTVLDRYASQFQTNNDLITTELCAQRERIAELEGCLKEIVDCQYNPKKTLGDLNAVIFESKSLIHKSDGKN